MGLLAQKSATRGTKEFYAMPWSGTSRAPFAKLRAHNGLTAQPILPKLRLVKHMHQDVTRLRILALFLGLIFLAGQFHFCADLSASSLGVSVRFWDFLFYASFGFVVTSSVAIAVVLLVFCYLIVPSVGAMLFADRIGSRLAIGWTMGTLVSALGCYLSVLVDTPTGATIVVTFGGVLVVMFLLHLAVHHGRNTALAGVHSAQRELPQEGVASSRQ
jgi:hypothetical protein